MATRTVIDTNVIVASLSSRSKHHWLIEFLIYQIREPDDNKFVDCYIAAGAEYLITHDKHFDVLAAVPFPKVNVVRIDEFMAALNIHQ